MRENAKKLMCILPFAFVGIAFLAFGIFLRNRLPWDQLFELHGLDYGIHGFKFSHFHWIGQMDFRHPLFPFLTSPLTLFGHRLRMLGMWQYWTFLLIVFSATMALATALVHSILKAADTGRGPAIVGTALFASFSYTWILAACPESFPFACVGLLMALRWGVSKSAKGNRRAQYLTWMTLGVLNGGITLTHGPKVVLAYLAARGFTLRRILRVMALLAGVTAIFLLLMAGRYLIFNLTHTETKCHFSDGFVKSFISFTTGIDWSTRAKLIVNFFTEPIITHGDAWEVNHLSKPYGSWISPCALLALYVAAVAGAILRWRTPLVRMLLAMFSIDFVLHVVCFWGMDEGHIYCGHWLFVPALLAAQLPAALLGIWRKLSLTLLFILAGIIFIASVCNLLTF